MQEKDTLMSPREHARLVVPMPEDPFIARRVQLVLAGLTRARSGASPHEVIGFARDFEAWIGEGKDEEDRALRHRAMMIAYQHFHPAGVEATLQDSAQAVYDYLRPPRTDPVAPPKLETKPPRRTRGARANPDAEEDAG